MNVGGRTQTLGILLERGPLFYLFRYERGFVPEGPVERPWDRFRVSGFSLLLY